MKSEILSDEMISSIREDARFFARTWPDLPGANCANAAILLADECSQLRRDLALSERTADETHRREETALDLIGRLVAGIENWADQEDGVPDTMFADYQEAIKLISSGYDLH